MNTSHYNFENVEHISTPWKKEVINEVFNTVHYYKVYTNNFGSPGKFVQLIKLFRLNDNTIRVKSDNGNISNVPASCFHIAKDTDALHYVPRLNHVGYILEEYLV